jgi:D-sedoheptulose 7-phosphate isomerase
MINDITRQLQEHLKLMEAVEQDMLPQIAEMAVQLADTFNSGNKLLVMGNGGSAADSQHFVAEIVSRFRMERKALPAVALSTDTSILTAIGNDYGFESVFSRQVEALAVAGDMVVGISTSGNSPNVEKALALARTRGCRTVGLLGRDGGSIRNVCSLSLIVPSQDTPRIQEAHITIIHIVCDLVEKALFS